MSRPEEAKQRAMRHVARHHPDAFLAGQVDGDRITVIVRGEGRKLEYHFRVEDW